ncbi:MAG: sodium:solute symporter family transporter [Sedimentisphaerales bacterium]
MKYLNGFDYVVIAIYFSILVGISLYLKKRASASLEDYFLGGKKLPWWALGISGMASWLDMTGTMVIVSFLYMLGPRGLYIELRGGVALPLAFMIVWTGKWHRRSNCMTGAEWNAYRFGEGVGGQLTRIVAAAATMLGTVGMLAYLIKGAGMFLSMFLPWSPLVCSLILVAVATLYTMVSGFYGVVYTDMFQSVIILVAVVIISVMAFLKVAEQGNLAMIAAQVTGNQNWTSAACSWETTMPPGYEVYHNLMMFAFFYFLRNFLGGFGTGADPKYFGAKNERECGILSFFWGWLLMFRWPLMMGFAILGIYLINDLFPDKTVISQSAAIIKQHVGNIPKARWSDTLVAIANNNHGTFSPDLISNLQQMLGSDWSTKLKLVSYEGTVNPEYILPAVLLFNIPMGLRGLFVTALIAAAMTTFASPVNATAGYFTRDLYQRYFRPKASTPELMIATYFFIILTVFASFVMAYTTTSINDIWGWIMMGLGGGFLLPSVLRLYWWRFNAAGAVVGVFVGMLGAILQRIFYPEMVEWQQFVIIGTIGLAGSVIGTYCSPPTPSAVLENFYKTTRPFGPWGPLKKILSPEVRVSMRREHINDMLALPFALGWMVSLFLLPMELLVRNFYAFGITLVVFLICLAGLYKFWYKNLPPATSPEQDAANISYTPNTVSQSEEKAPHSK